MALGLSLSLASFSIKSSILYSIPTPAPTSIPVPVPAPVTTLVSFLAVALLTISCVSPGFCGLDLSRGPAGEAAPPWPPPSSETLSRAPSRYNCRSGSSSESLVSAACWRNRSRVSSHVPELCSPTAGNPWPSLFSRSSLSRSSMSRALCVAGASSIEPHTPLLLRPLPAPRETSSAGGEPLRPPSPWCFIPLAMCRDPGLRIRQTSLA
mmetsp:Transcript_14185/g.34390  ORF Transcript_14185/g.34390 Transcript_14185/m.34390 type:complete len:209 (+) Transcript_14185:1781-2407(+)